MALTDVFISPSGAGDNSGSSVANALPAISSGDWSTNIEGLDRANKRFVFLEGTYNVTTKLTFTGSAPTDEQPNQWVGAKSDGTILRPKFDETGLRLDLTNYPLFVCSANVQMINTEEYSFYKCLSFENTNASYSQGSIIEATSGDVDGQMWLGCNFKAAPADNSATVFLALSTQMSMCVFEATTKQYAEILEVRTNSNIRDCRIIGGGDSSPTGGNGDGVTATAFSSNIEGCVIANVHGDGFFMNTTSNRQNPVANNCTIINCGANGIDASNITSNQANVTGVIDGTIIFNCAGKGIKADAADDRQNGAQLLAMGSNGANFENLDSYEDMIDVVAITTADFVDYASNDFRIRRDSVLYKFFGTHNFGAIQNEDFEFTSVS